MLTKHLFVLESGVITTTPATKEWFEENKLFTISANKESQKITFTSVKGGNRLVTSALVKVEHNSKGWIKFQTKHSTIQVWMLPECSYDFDYSHNDHEKILVRSNYRGYDFVISEYNGTMNAAIVIPSNHSLHGIEAGDLPFAIKCHHGVTGCGEYDYLPGEWTIFWDYDHLEDYSECSPRGYKWSLAEVAKECYEAIDDLIIQLSH